MPLLVKRLNTVYDAIIDIPEAIHKTAYIKNIKPDGVDGHAASIGAYAIAEFNTLSGDTSFIQLIANQIILQPGTYRIEGQVPHTRTVAATGTSYHKAKLRNISGPTDVLIGSSASQDLSTAGYRGNVYSFLSGQITINSQQTFEVVQRTNVAGVVGYSVNHGDVEVYSQLKITKIETLNEAQ
jgi:hypothetical protein